VFSPRRSRPRIWPGCCESTHRTKQGRTEAKPKHTEGATMIAATAFAVVGLVVVAFLNRIP
jgi:hypothetical protein